MSLSQLSDKYEEFVTPSEKEELIAKLQEVEDWLYEDGEDETKGVYIAKLEELKKVLFFYVLTTPFMPRSFPPDKEDGGAKERAVAGGEGFFFCVVLLLDCMTKSDM